MQTDGLNRCICRKLTVGVELGTLVLDDIDVIVFDVRKPP